MKNYLKTGILLLGILTVTINCEKEPLVDDNNPIEESNTTSTHIEYITSNDVPQIISTITSLTGEKSKKDGDNSKTLSYKKARIDIDNILKIKNYQNITNYTFNIFVQNAPLNEFYNLVINEDSKKNVKKPYVIKYVVAEDALDIFLSNNLNFSYFKGTKYIISFNNFFDNYNTASKSYGDCSTDGTPINNTGNGGSGGIRDIPIDNHLQTDPNQYNYGEPNAGDSYTIFFNSYNTTDQSSTSYADPVRNEAFFISTTTSPGGMIEVNVPNSGIVNSPTPNAVKISSSDKYYPVYDGSGGNGNNCKILITIEYSDGTTSTYETSCTQAQQKQAYSSKTYEECPESEGEVGVISSPLIVKDISLCLGNLTIDQISFLQTSTSTPDIHNFLIEDNNCSDEAKNFTEQAIEIFDEPLLTINNQEIDYENKILYYILKLKQFGNPEDEIFADYLDSLIPFDSSFTKQDKFRIYQMAQKQVYGLFQKYLLAVVVPFAEAAYPFVVYAVTEATLGAAIPLISKIPLNMVSRGVRLNKMLTKLSKIGTPISGNEFFRKIPQSSVQKALKLFEKLTKNAISPPTTNAQGTIVANMGNNTYITFRTVSDTPGVIATIDINASSLFSQIIKLKFYQ